VGEEDASHGVAGLSLYLLDSTVLIAHLRGDSAATRLLLDLLAENHSLGTSCVNVADVERGVRPRERKSVNALLDRLRYLETTREAAARAGRYQADFGRRGRTIHLADALIAGTARAHGAILVTEDVADFPMRDIRVESLARSRSYAGARELTETAAGGEPLHRLTRHVADGIEVTVVMEERHSIGLRGRSDE
jgi:predicted nucleic acid-binding protein